MHNLMTRLFPLCRSITGDGVRETFRIIKERIPLEVTEVPSGTECFDWTIPDEWNIASAWIKDESGRTIVDFADCNLHVLGYSEPVSGTFTLEELKPHLHSNPNQPDVIPYLTSYYKHRWGFCMSHKQLQSLPEGRYQVEIKSSLQKGSLTLAETFIPGKSKKEVIPTRYTCHPSMANDSLSGVVLNVKLCEHLLKRKDNRFSYRFIFAPETIGTIAYLARNKDRVLTSTHCVLVLTCVGGPGAFTYKRTKFGHPLDRITENVLKHSGKEHVVKDFFLPGSDERQYSTPGFNIPAASLMKAAYGFPEYHTSADDLKLVTAESLEESFDLYVKLIEAIEGNATYINLKPFCEPFLSKYGLYETIGGQKNPSRHLDTTKQILYILNYSDGRTPLIDIADKGNFSLLDLINTAHVLEEKGLLQRV